MNALEQPFRLRDFTVDPGALSLTGPGGEQHLPLRLMNLLCLLAASPGETLGRDALVSALWPRGYVNEEALSRAVAELRQHLGDDARQPVYIQTVPKLGYRLIANVEDADTVAAAAPAATSKAPWIVAVLVVLAGIAWLGDARRSVAPPLNPALAATAERVTADPNIKYHPELSPDGQWLAFIRRGEPGGQVVILPTAQPTDERTLALPGSLWSPTFSPDSARLAVASLGEAGCEILLLPLGSLEPEILTACLFPSESPILDMGHQGQWLAFVDRDEATGSSAIWRLSLSDGRREQLTHPPDDYVFDTRPRISPDGRWLSFTRGTRAAREIWLLDLKSPGEPLRQLSSDHQYILSHDWLDDSLGMVLDSERSGHRALWMLSLAGDWQLLGARDAHAPTIAGNRIGFRISQYESNIWAMDPASGELGEAPLIQSSKYDSNPQWSPDGNEIAFSSNRTGRGGIWISSADGTRQRRVYEPEAGRVVWPAWSPAGDFLTATRYRPGGQELIQIALNQKSVEVIPTRGERPYGGAYSPDGQWLFYMARGGVDGNRLWRQPADGSAEATIWLDRPVNRFRFEDDFLLLTEHDRDGLFRVPASDPAQVEAVMPELPAAFWDDWTSHQGWVYYPALETDRFVLHRRQLSTGESERISDIIPTALGPNLSIHPVTGQLLVSRTDRVQSDLFLGELRP